jgi:hypothetical protein
MAIQALFAWPQRWASGRALRPRWASVFLTKIPRPLAGVAPFVAAANNPSAIYYNPAGITQLEGHNIQTAHWLISASMRNTKPGRQTSITTLRSFRPADSLRLHAGKFAARSAWELRALRPLYGMAGRYRVPHAFDRSASAIPHDQSRLGWKPCRPSIAAGPTINYSEIDLATGWFLRASPNDEFKFNRDNWSAGFNVGILINRIPVVLRSELSQRRDYGLRRNHDYRVPCPRHPQRKLTPPWRRPFLKSFRSAFLIDRRQNGTSK